MTSSKLRHFFSVSILFFLMLFVTAIANAEIKVDLDTFQVIEKVRSGRTAYNYTATIELYNTDNNIYEPVYFAALSKVESTQILTVDENVGAIDSQGRITVEFRFRQDRRSQFSLDNITWKINPFTAAGVDIEVQNFTPDTVFIDENYEINANVLVTTSIAGTVIHDVHIADVDNELYLDLYDNGSLMLGDDIAGDGVFSARRFFNNQEPNVLILRVIVQVDVGGSIYNVESKKFLFSVLTPLTDEEYEFANNSIVESETLYEEMITSGLTEEEAKENLVNSLLSQPEIFSAGVAADGKGGVWWVTNGLVKCGLFLGPEGTKSNETNDVFSWSTYKFSFDPYDDYDGAAKLLRDSECPIYTETGNTNLGATLEQLKDMDEYGVVVISSHGDNWYNGYWSDYEDHFGCDDDCKNQTDWLEDTLSEVIVNTRTYNSKAYSKDLKAQRVVLTNGNRLAITPAFVKTYCKNMPGTIVYISSCRSIYNLSMAKAFTKNGASLYIGYTDYVDVEQAFDTGKDIFEDLLDGSTALTAVGAARLKYCHIGQDCAEVDYWGDVFATLNFDTIKNGDFQNGLKGWQCSGDVRTISKLGPITRDGKMAIISTGLGSVTDSISWMRQEFCYNGEPSLSFDYNVVSEEPMEFVGSMFDDGFRVNLIKEDGSVQQLAYESINSSSWSHVSGIDFAGGDDTVYQTGWKSVDIDLTDAGEDVIKVEFEARVWDTGDSAYDTAALIDNIQLDD